jgi:DNA-binding transcriptional LysR family regulator
VGTKGLASTRSGFMPEIVSAFQARPAKPHQRRLMGDQRPLRTRSPAIGAVPSVEGPTAWLEPAFTSHVTMVLVVMARDGRGIAGSPKSLIVEYLATGRLVRAGSEMWDIAIEIHLFRPRTRQSVAAEKFWSTWGRNVRARA